MSRGVAPATAAEAREWIERGWQRLERLLADEGRAVHACMVASWGIVIKDDTGAPCGWRMAINIGSMPPETWAQGVKICRDAVEVETEEEAEYLVAKAAKEAV